jgi:hypothetical protein
MPRRVFAAHIKNYQHDYLVVSYETHQKFLDPEKAASYKYGEKFYLGSYIFYSKLNENQNSNHQLIREFGALKIYERLE